MRMSIHHPPPPKMHRLGVGTFVKAKDVFSLTSITIKFKMRKIQVRLRLERQRARLSTTCFDSAGAAKTIQQSAARTCQVCPRTNSEGPTHNPSQLAYSVGIKMKILGSDIDASTPMDVANGATMP